MITMISFKIYVEKFEIKSGIEFLLVVLTRNKSTSGLIQKHLPDLVEQITTVLEV